MPRWARKQVASISAGMGSKALPGPRPSSSLGFPKGDQLTLFLTILLPSPSSSTSLPLSPQSVPQGQKEVAAGPPVLAWVREGLVYLSEQSNSAGNARGHLHSQTWLQPPKPGPRSDPQTAAGLRVPSNAFLCGERGKTGKIWVLGHIPQSSMSL